MQKPTAQGAAGTIFEASVYPIVAARMHRGADGPELHAARGVRAPTRPGYSPAGLASSSTSVRSSCFECTPSFS